MSSTSNFALGGILLRFSVPPHPSLATYVRLEAPLPVRLDGAEVVSDDLGGSHGIRACKQTSRGMYHDTWMLGNVSASSMAPMFRKVSNTDGQNTSWSQQGLFRTYRFLSLFPNPEPGGSLSHQLGRETAGLR